MNTFKLLFVLSVSSLVSCINLRDTSVPDVSTLAPDSWFKKEARHLSSFESISASEQLNDLIVQALSNNYNLQATARRLLASQLQAEASFGGRLPSASISLNNQTQKTASSIDNIDSATGNLIIDWELDVWGKLAAAEKASVALAKEQAYLFNASQYSLAAQVTKLWFDTIEARQQLSLTQRRIINLENSLAVIEDGFNSGIRTALDVYSAQAELVSNQSTLAQRELALNNVLRQLSVLLGQKPDITRDIPEDLPRFTVSVPEKLASNMIIRRPDMLAAEQALISQHSNVGIALANRLPSFNFTGRAGAASSNLSDVLSGQESTWSLFGGITAPLFQGKKLLKEQTRQRRLLEAQIAVYKQTALTAFKEVEDTLDGEYHLSKQEKAAIRAVEISIQAEQQALEQYVSGISNLNTWLQAQRTSFDRQSSLLQTKTNKLKNRVDMYLALGGNFNESGK